MKSWQFAVLRFAVLGTLCLSLPACRSRPNQTVSLLERELRDQEDEIYRLKNQLKRCQETGDSSSFKKSTSERPEREGIGPKLLLDFSGAKPAAGIGKPPKPSTDTSESGTAPRWGIADPSSDSPAPESLPDLLRMPSGGPTTEAELPDSNEPGESDPPENESDPTDQVDNRQVQQIVLNPQFSGGYDADGEPGHEGIVVVVEPRDGQGRPLDAPADASVVIIDPAIADETGRVARWDLTASETARLFGRSGGASGMQLALRWPDRPPIHPDVRLFVRYTTRDGRMLQADMPMRIDLPEAKRPQQTDLGWTKADSSSTIASATPPSSEDSPPRTTFRTRVPTLAIRPSENAEVSSGSPKKPNTVAGRPSWTPNRQ